MLVAPSPDSIFGPPIQSPTFVIPSAVRSPVAQTVLDVIAPYDPRAYNAAQQIVAPTILKPPSNSTGVPIEQGKVSPWFDRTYNDGGDPVHEWYCYIYPSEFVPPQPKTTIVSTREIQPTSTGIGIPEFSGTTGRLTRLHVTLVDSKDLGVGSRNIYLVFSIGNQIKASSAKPLRPTPVWNERISLDVDYSEELRVQLLDADTREPLGLGLFNLDEAFLHDLLGGPKEKWLRINLKDGNSGAVRLLLQGEFAELGPLRNAHITVVEGRDLAGGPHDLYFVLSVDGQPKATTAKPSAAPVWNEEFLFPANGELQLRCQDAADQQADAWSLGSLHFEPGLIKEIEQGRVERWVQLQRADGKTGRVLLSLERGPDEDPEPHSRELQFPLGGELQKLVVTVIDGKNLLDMDVIRKSDPYVKLQVGSQVQNTTVKNNSLSPVWNEQFAFDVESGNEISLVMLDKDTLQDDLMGRGAIKLDDYLVQQLREGPVDKRVDLLLNGKNAGFVRATLQAQFGPKLGKLSDFSGLKVTIGDSKDLFTGPQTPASGYVIATIGSQAKPTTAKPADQHITWHETLEFDALDGEVLKLRAQDATQREKAAWGTALVPLDSALLGELHYGRAERWIPIQRKDGQTGLLRIYIDGIPKEAAGASRDIASSSLAAQIQRIRINVVKGQNLNNGNKPTADPLAQITFGGDARRTTFKRNTLNPVWNETLQFAGCGASELGIGVFDQQRLKLDKMGEGTLRLDDETVAALKQGSIEKKVDLTRDGKSAGSIFLNIDAEFESGSALLEPERYAVTIVDGQNLFGAKNQLLYLDLGGTHTSARESSPNVNWNETLMVEIANRLDINAVDPQSLGLENWASGKLSINENTVKEIKAGRFEQTIPMKRNDGKEGLVKVSIKPIQVKSRELSHLQVTVVDAKGLPNCDEKGKSDPFLQLSLGPQTQTTSVKMNTLKPVWNERFLFNVNGHSDLALKMFDRDVKSEDDVMGNGSLNLDAETIKALQLQNVEKTVKLTNNKQNAGTVRLILEGKFRQRGQIRNQPLSKINVIIADGQDIGGPGAPAELYIIGTVGQQAKPTTTLPGGKTQTWGEVLEFDVEDASILHLRAQNAQKREEDGWALGQLSLDDGLTQSLASGPVERWVPMQRQDGKMGMLKVILESADVKDKAPEKVTVTVNEGRGLSGGWPPAGEVYLAVNLGTEFKATTSQPAGDSQKWDELLLFNVASGSPDVRVQVVDTSQRETLGTGTVKVNWNELNNKGQIQTWMEIAMKDGRVGYVSLGISAYDEAEILRQKALEEARLLEEQRRLEEEARKRKEEEERRRREEEERRRKEDEERRLREDEERRRQEEEARRRMEEEERRRREEEEEERRRREEEERRRKEEEEAAKPKTRAKKGSSKKSSKKASAKLGARSVAKIQARPWIGLEIKMLDDESGNPDVVVVIHSVTPDSPAQKAGLLEEDIIESWNGDPLKSKISWDNHVKSSTIGSKVDLAIIRNGNPLTIQVTISSTQRMLGGKRKVTSKKQVRGKSGTRSIPKGAKKKSPKGSPRKAKKKAKKGKKKSKKSAKKA